MAKIISVGGIIRIKIIKKISITSIFNMVIVTLLHLSISINIMLTYNIIFLVITKLKFSHLNPMFHHRLKCLAIKNYKFIIY